MARKYKPLVQIASRISEEAKTRLTTQAIAENATLSEIISNILEDADINQKAVEVQSKAIQDEFDSFTTIIAQYLLKKDFGNRIDNMGAIMSKINAEKLKKEVVTQKAVKK